jgi:hypothetical protein
MRLGRQFEVRNKLFFSANRIYPVCMKKFTAILHRGEPGEGGFWATCLEVPGANGQGETREECLANLKEAFNCSSKLNVKKCSGSTLVRKRRSCS